MTVVMAARGYPGEVARGEPIGLSEDDDPRVKVFHAGTRLADGRLVSNGGRVLNATARAASSPKRATSPTRRSTPSTGPAASPARDIGWRALGAALPL